MGCAIGTSISMLPSARDGIWDKNAGYTILSAVWNDIPLRRSLPELSSLSRTHHTAMHKLPARQA